MRKMASRVSSPTNKPCTDGSSSRMLTIGLQNRRTLQLNLVSNLQNTHVYQGYHYSRTLTAIYRIVVNSNPPRYVVYLLLANNYITR